MRTGLVWIALNQGGEKVDWSVFYGYDDVEEMDWVAKNAAHCLVTPSARPDTQYLRPMLGSWGRSTGWRRNTESTSWTSLEELINYYWVAVGFAELN